MLRQTGRLPIKRSLLGWGIRNGRKAAGPVLHVGWRYRNADSLPLPQPELRRKQTSDCLHGKMLNLQRSLATEPLRAEAAECVLPIAMREEPQDLPWNKSPHHA